MSNLLIHEPPLQVLPSLAKAIGLNEAIILQQIHYWLGRSEHDYKGMKWVYKTYDEWAIEFPFWSISTIKRSIYKLENAKYIQSTEEFNKVSTDRTKWYTINYNHIPRSAQNDTLEGLKMTRSRVSQNDTLLHYTENTTENTHQSENGKTWIFSAYTRFFREVVASGEHDDLGELTIYDPNDVFEAMKITQSANSRKRISRKVAYMRGILQDWAANGKPVRKPAQEEGTPIKRKIYR